MAAARPGAAGGRSVPRAAPRAGAPGSATWPGRRGRQADQGAAPPVRRRADRDPDPGQREPGPASRAAADGGPEADARASRAACPATCRGAARRRRRSAAECARRKPIQVVYGPGTFINESARQIAVRFNAERGARPQGGATRPRRPARKVAAAPGQEPGRAGAAWPRRRGQLALAQSFQDALGLALRYGLSRVPAAQRSRLRAEARVRAVARLRHAEVALRVPVPDGPDAR